MCPCVWTRTDTYVKGIPRKNVSPTDLIQDHGQNVPYPLVLRKGLESETEV